MQSIHKVSCEQFDYIMGNKTLYSMIIYQSCCLIKLILTINALLHRLPRPPYWKYQGILDWWVGRL